MDTDPFIRRAVQQAADNRLVLNALQAALRTLQQHSGITCHAEGEVFPLDFEPEIRVVSSSPVEGSIAAALLAEWDSPDEKKGWPWPQPGSTS
ncbi:hypothetical protein LJR267_009903 [Paraburkholderia hospita]|jgi:hypothetical protein|uniref:hypothetical protein n=1 Tax=Paraburkholderia hospita TaxID=169430 RepID=UPI003ECEF0BF